MSLNLPLIIIHKSDDLEEKQALVKAVEEEEKQVLVEEVKEEEEVLEEKQVLVGDKVVSLAAPST